MTADVDNLRQALAAAGETFAEADAARERALEQVIPLLVAAVDAGVPKAEAARLAQVSRTTAYKLLDGRRS